MFLNSHAYLSQFTAQIPELYLRSCFYHTFKIRCRIFRQSSADFRDHSWIIPSNPKYYDIIHAFDETDTIDWKQGAGIKKGDTVFMYVGAPVSAVLYKCKVTETNIPYQYQDKNLAITALMKIQLLERYAPDQFTFEKLKTEYGVYAVRGPRGIPDSLSAALEKAVCGNTE